MVAAFETFGWIEAVRPSAAGTYCTPHPRPLKKRTTTATCLYELTRGEDKQGTGAQQGKGNLVRALIK